MIGSTVINTNPEKRFRQGFRHRVFWPPFLLLLGSVLFSLLYPGDFLQWLTDTNREMLDLSAWLFSITAFGMVVLIIIIFLTRFGSIRIGGQDAKPLLSRWSWFTVILCTTIAIGVLFWAAAEPLYHLNQPTQGSGANPNTYSAMRFSLATMFMHWSFTPYALYAVPALMFAITYYNLGQPFSLGSLLAPLLGDAFARRWSWLIDIIALYTLVAGMSASLGTGILALAGGLHHILPELTGGSLLYGCLIGLVVCTFVISASSGLMKGIRILSDLNVKFFIFLILFVLITGPTVFMLDLGLESLGDFLVHFAERSVFSGEGADGEWARQWTVFYWANWLAWTPVTALFLGRIAYGYTVRDFIVMNFLLPSLFAICWITIFSGTTLHIQFYHQGLLTLLQSSGPEAITYAILETLPWSRFIIPFFLLLSFVSFVTAADSNTSAMSSMSTSGINPDNPESRTSVKIIWGSLIGAMAWILLSRGGIEGIKMLSNLGGFPALILEILVAMALIKVIITRKGRAPANNSNDNFVKAKPPR
ncbi:MAG: BCCT family transporter [Leptospiraceae bacterium]|nr:BCCT family transporter [Leptospiraceae bacterium]